MESDFEHNLAASLWLFFSPVLLIVGVFGNCLSLIVLVSPSFAKNSAAFGLSALAVVDTGVLVVSLLRHWIFYLTDGVEVRTLFFSFGCKVQAFLAYYLSHLSSWTVVMVTVERAVSVLCPLTVKSRLTRSKVVFIWFLLSSVICLINAHFFWTVGFTENDNSTASSTTTTTLNNDNFSATTSTTPATTTTTTIITAAFNISYAFNTSTIANSNSGSLIPSPQCYFKNPKSHFSTTVWPWLDFFLSVAIPFLAIAFFNILIAICVWRTVSARNLNRHRPVARHSNKENSSAEEVRLNVLNSFELRADRNDFSEKAGERGKRSASCLNLKLSAEDYVNQGQEKRARKGNKAGKNNPGTDVGRCCDAFPSPPRFSRDERELTRAEYDDLIERDLSKRRLKLEKFSDSDSFLKFKFVGRSNQEAATTGGRVRDQLPTGWKTQQQQQRGQNFGAPKMSFQAAATTTGGTPLRKKFSVRKRDQILAPFTAMLFGLGVMFLVTNAPSGVYFILQESLFQNIKHDHDYDKLGPIRLAFAVVNLLYFVNHSANFFLYCLTGSKFRMALRKMLRCKQAKKISQQPKTHQAHRNQQQQQQVKLHNLRGAFDGSRTDVDNYGVIQNRRTDERHMKFVTMNAF